MFTSFNIKLFTFLAFSFFFGKMFAQTPGNDDCSNATVILFGADNYQVGKFASANSNITGATKTVGEYFHSTQIAAGTDKKSVWFKFTLATARYIKVELKQPGNDISQDGAGFTVFKSNTCTGLGTKQVTDAKLTSVAKFGASFNPCLTPGEYLVQVSAKSASNGDVFIEITADSTEVLNQFDFNTQAFDFGETVNIGKSVTYDAGCQSIDGTAYDQCSGLTGAYTQSSWFVFKTGVNKDYFDIRVLNNSTGQNLSDTVGFKLYKGDARLGVPASPVFACSELKRPDLPGEFVSNYFFCELEPAEYYTIQLIYKADVYKALAVNVQSYGNYKTNGANPNALDVGNKIGVLSLASGSFDVNYTDNFGCNGFMKENLCGTNQPTEVTFQTKKYDLATWFTFEIEEDALLTLETSGESCCSDYLKRIFRGDISTDCNLPLVFETLTDTTISCFPAGKYSLQILGQSAGTGIGYDVSRFFHFGKPVNLHLKATAYGKLGDFDLKQAGKVDTMKNLQSFVHGERIGAQKSMFGCRNTALPEASAGDCGATTKAMYRMFKLDKPGKLFIFSGADKDESNSYRLYKGNAADLASAQNAFNFPQQITGLTPQGTCFSLSTYINAKGVLVRTHTLVCVDAGTYTLVTFGSDADLNRFDQPEIMYVGAQFNLTDETDFDAVKNVASVHTAVVPGELTPAAGTFFPCNRTVLPDGDLSLNGNDDKKAIYRIIKVNDTGILTSWCGAPVCEEGHAYRMYKGNAADLAKAQNVFSFPQKITGLTDLASYQFLNWTSITCDKPNLRESFKVCAEPGFYSLVTFADDADPLLENGSDQPEMQLDIINSLYDDPTKPYVFETIKSAGANVSFTGTVDYFTCKDNEATIDGLPPIAGTTKLIYRQFYVEKPSVIGISQSGERGTLRLFKGRADAGLGTLKLYSDTKNGAWDSFTGLQCDICEPMPAGWYTVVSYGSGSTWVNPVYTAGRGADIGFTTNVTISMQFIPSANFNRPYKAAFAAVDYDDTGGTAAFPATAQRFTFPAENFDCNTDVPFNTHPVEVCFNRNYNRIAYFVFELKREAFVHIDGIPTNMASKIYAFDVRTDSVKMTTETPLQPCISLNSDNKALPHGGIEFCKLQPGFYTLVCFAGDNMKGLSFQPSIYVDKIQDSRFDFAAKAYDFGDIKSDGLEYFGKPGDVNPFDTNRAPSNDFISCKTGANITDPGDLDPNGGKCGIGSFKTGETTSIPYPIPNNYVVYATDTVTLPFKRRNLWYTFTITGSGNITLNTYCKTPSTAAHKTDVPFAVSVYLSNEDGSFLFSTLVSTGKVDSTLAQGLSYITSNSSCGNQSNMRFNIGSCEELKTRRYYVVVDLPASLAGDVNWYANVLPSVQFELGIKYNPQPVLGQSYDLFADANVINGLNQTKAPYTAVKLKNGTYTGDLTSFSCASRSIDDPNDPAGCALRTIWYKFETETDGQILMNYDIQDLGLKFQTNLNEFQLYKQNGAILQNMLPSGFITADTSWVSYCAKAGTYYIMFTGCGYTTELVFPRIKLKSVLTPYDDISEVNVINGLNQKQAPYTPVILSPGTFVGDTACFACATRSLQDPPENAGCANKTIWYKFSMNTSGSIFLNFDLPETGQKFINSTSDILLYKINNENDLSPAGSSYVPPTGTVGGDTSWVAYCGTPGDYYILLTGCNYSWQKVVPRVKIQTNPGDLCVAPLNITLNTSGAASTSVNINCHSMGQDYGENAVTPNLGCMLDAAQPVYNAGTKSYNYKTSWFKVNLNFTAKMDITLSLQENTNVMPNEITFRAMLGTCGAMTPYLCSTDALTGTTLNCMPGSGYFYVQVLSPANAVGDISLHFSASESTDQLCEPLDLTKPLANFIFSGTCAADTFAFTNFSTAGTDIEYTWNFGDGTISSEIHPKRVFKNLVKDSVFTVKLKVLNKTVNSADSVSVDVPVYVAEFVGLSDTVYSDCGVNSVLLDAGAGFANYAWNTGEATQSITANTAGKYHITVTDNFACKASDTLMVEFPPAVVFDVSVASNSPLCVGDTLKITTTSPQNLNYAWSGVSGFSSILKNPKINTVNLPNAGTYTLIAELDHCFSAPYNLNVVINPNPVVSLGKDTAICANESLIIDAGAGFDSYLWNTASNLQTISVNSQGKYSVKVMQLGCAGYDTVSVSIKAIPMPELGEDIAVCADKEVVLNPGNNFETYLWNDASIGGDLKALVSGKYWVRVTNLNNCTNSDTVNVTIYPVPEIIMLDNSLEYTVVVVLGNGTQPFLFTANNGAAQESPVFARLTPGNYTFEVTDANQCTDEKSIEIIEIPISMPNFFTPNGDGIHDTWEIKGISAYPEADVRIYDRFGKLLARYTGADKGWDGTYNGKLMPSDTYWYIVDPNALDFKPMHGYVTLKR